MTTKTKKEIKKGITKFMWINFVIFCFILATSIFISSYLFRIEEEIIFGENIKNHCKKIMKLQYIHQQDKNVIYFILPEEYTSDEIDEYVENYGKERNLKLDTIFFEYNSVIYTIKK